MICEICKKETQKRFIGENGIPVPRCEDCNDKIVKESKRVYAIKYERALKYLKDNNYVVKVDWDTGKSESEARYFDIEDEHMACVDLIRSEMKQLGFDERWIDVHFESYEDCQLEIVDYLYFAKYKNNKEIDRRSFYINLEKKLSNK